MEVALVRPPRGGRWTGGGALPPLGLLQVAAALEAAGHRVEVLDAFARRYGWGDIEGWLQRRAPDLIGLGTMTPTIDLDRRLATLARRAARFVVAGGPHVSALGEEGLAELPVDAAVVGEADESFPALVSWLGGGAEGAPPPGCIVPGRPFSPAAPPAALDRLPWPARHLVRAKDYRYIFAGARPLATMVTSRGCPYPCTFCDKSVSGSVWRARSAESVVEELKVLARTHRSVIFFDDSFTHDQERTAAICEGILREGIPLRWKCESRPDHVDLPLLELMARAGCTMVAFGVESASPETLRRLRKGFTVEQVEEAFLQAHLAGLETLAYVMLGVPGEGLEELEATLALCQRIRVTWVQFSTLSITPGAALSAAALGETRQLQGFLDHDLARPTATDLPPAVLGAHLKRAWRGFYLRPRPMLRLGLAAARSGMIPGLLGDLPPLLRWYARGAGPG